MKRIGWASVFAILVLGTSDARAGSVVYDLAADFSTTNGNPNGAWSYGYMNAGVFTPYVSSSSNAWMGNIGGDGTPIVWKNTGGGTAYGVAPGQVSLHPGPSGQASVARWTAPAGLLPSITLTGQFFPGDIGTMGVAIIVNDNWGVPLFQASDQGAFSYPLTVAPGSTIDFAVFGGYAFGNTPVDAVIRGESVSSVPEPSTIIAAVGGSIALLWIRRRRHA